MTVSMKKSKPNELKMENIVLKEEEVVTILGVDISKDLNWHNHIRNISKRVAQRISVLRKTRNYLSAEHIVHLYKAQVRPVMEYCSQV